MLAASIVLERALLAAMPLVKRQSTQDQQVPLEWIILSLLILTTWSTLKVWPASG